MTRAGSPEAGDNAHVVARPNAEPPGVVALDALSRRLLAAAEPLRVAPTAGRVELDAVHRLRYAHVVEHGWSRPEQHPDGLERDAYDERAVQIAAWEEDRLAGALRLVLPAPGARLPVEDAFDLDVEPRGAVVDVGRLLIATGHRGDPAHRLWGALFARAWLEVRARGFAVLAGTATADFVARYQAVGLEFELLGRARSYWERSAIRCGSTPAATAHPGGSRAEREAHAGQLLRDAPTAGARGLVRRRPAAADERRVPALLAAGRPARRSCRPGCPAWPRRASAARPSRSLWAITLVADRHDRVLDGVAGVGLEVGRRVAGVGGDARERREPAASRRRCSSSVNSRLASLDWP